MNAGDDDTDGPTPEHLEEGIWYGSTFVVSTHHPSRPAAQASPAVQPEAPLTDRAEALPTGRARPPPGPFAGQEEEEELEEEVNQSYQATDEEFIREQSMERTKSTIQILIWQMHCLRNDPKNRGKGKRVKPQRGRELWSTQ